MGNLKAPLMELFGGFLLILVGVILASPLIDALGTVTLGTEFTGASSIKNLLPLIWFIALMGAGIGMVVHGFKRVRD